MDERITRDEALLQGLSTYFTGKPCKHGHVARRYVLNWTCVACHAQKSIAHQQIWRKNNPEKQKEYARKYAERKNAQMKIWRQENKERCAETQRNWNEKNKEKRNELSKNWRLRNRAAMNALKMKRHADILQRTPKWLTVDDFWLIQEAYALAKLRTALTGIDWQVDHVVPLRGRNVSGLHVPTNLRVVPASENRKKGNRYAVG